jgi:MoaA/NifB/PqqE/SkfB family radical SAM enzyme
METSIAVEQPAWLANTQIWNQEFRDGVSIVKSKPSFITLEVTAVCNLRCVHCPREYPLEPFVETEMDESVAESFLKDVASVNHLQLYGLGEPLLSKLFWRIVEDERTKDVPSVDINSNGTLFNSRNVDRLLKSNLNYVNVSLDAATPLTYKRIRGGNFDKVVEGLKRLTARRQELRDRNELGRPDFRIWMNMTLMMENIAELPRFMELAADVGADEVDVWHLNKRGDETGKDWTIVHDGWKFVYDEQHLSNSPALSNEMLRRAQAVATERGIAFKRRWPELWLPE